MKERKFRAKAQIPILSREASVGYETNETKWLLVDYQDLHGGAPLIEGLVSINVTKNSAKIPRYKIVFPDGHVDYVRIDIFNQWFDYELVEDKAGESQ